MGEKDVAERNLVMYADVFADIVNVLLLNGKQLIKPRDLKPAMRSPLYKDKDLHHAFRAI